MEEIMNKISEHKIFNLLLFVTIIGEFFVPWVLKHFYKGYDSKRMAMSVLGSPESPVRNIYNCWLIWLGIFLFITSIVFFYDIRKVSFLLAVLIFFSISIFAIGAGVLAGIFSVNESKDIVNIASKIHGIGAAIGFMTLLFFPMLSGIAALKQREIMFCIISIIAFVMAIIFFAFFIMGDKPQFKNTVFVYEGVWERLSLLAMYIPFVYKAIFNLIKVE